MTNKAQPRYCRMFCKKEHGGLVCNNESLRIPLELLPESPEKLADKWRHEAEVWKRRCLEAELKLGFLRYYLQILYDAAKRRGMDYQGDPELRSARGALAVIDAMLLPPVGLEAKAKERPKPEELT